MEKFLEPNYLWVRRVRMAYGLNSIYTSWMFFRVAFAFRTHMCLINECSTVPLLFLSPHLARLRIDTRRWLYSFWYRLICVKCSECALFDTSLINWLNLCILLIRSVALWRNVSAQSSVEGCIQSKETKQNRRDAWADSGKQLHSKFGSYCVLVMVYGWTSDTLHMLKHHKSSNRSLTSRSNVVFVCKLWMFMVKQMSEAQQPFSTQINSLISNSFPFLVLFFSWCLFDWFRSPILIFRQQNDSTNTRLLLRMNANEIDISTHSRMQSFRSPFIICHPSQMTQFSQQALEETRTTAYRTTKHTG